MHTAHHHNKMPDIDQLPHKIEASNCPTSREETMRVVPLETDNTPARQPPAQTHGSHHRRVREIEMPNGVAVRQYHRDSALHPSEMDMMTDHQFVVRITKYNN